MTTQDDALSEDDRRELTRLEEAMWREATRYDPAFMQRHLAQDFFEFGRSGRSYSRAQILAQPRHPIDAVLPLPQLWLRRLAGDTVQLTYRSAVTEAGQVLHARRCSIWSRTASGWLLRFHQGTPCGPESGAAPEPADPLDGA